MTEKQISIVKRTWKIFRSIDPIVVGDVFYGKLFSDVPQVKHLFTTDKEIQYRKIIDMLTMMVMRLDRLDEISQDIRDLAIRHVHYGTRPAHYKAVGQALLWTLQQGLGKDWNAEVKQAWDECYTTLANIMLEAVGQRSEH